MRCRSWDEPICCWSVNGADRTRDADGVQGKAVALSTVEVGDDAVAVLVDAGADAERAGEGG